MYDIKEIKMWPFFFMHGGTHLSDVEARIFMASTEFRFNWERSA